MVESPPGNTRRTHLQSTTLARPSKRGHMKRWRLRWNRTAASEWACIVNPLLVILLAFLQPSQPQQAHDSLSASIIAHWPMIGSWLIALVCVGLFYLARRTDRDSGTSLSSKNAEVPKPDASVKDSDPRLEIKFVDDRFVSGSSSGGMYAYFDVINRAQSHAKSAYIEDFYIRSHFVRMRHVIPALAPGICKQLRYDVIDGPDGRDSKLDIFDVFHKEWESLHDAQIHELPVQIKVTYQDDFRNLFEIRCVLVFSPSNFLRGRDATGPVLEIKNPRTRRVASVITPIDWT